MHTTHPSLLSRVRDLDDHAAWHEFDARYRELILRYCRRRDLQPADAEDVRQMVMLNLARHLRQFRYRPERGRFRGYLGRTVQNAIHRRFRRPNAEVHGLDVDDSLPIGDSIDQDTDPEWEAEWRDHHFRLAMDTLRNTVQPRSLEVFEHLLAGETPAEVAEHFGMSFDAVHKIKQRMRKRLQELIARQVWEEDGLDGVENA